MSFDTWIHILEFILVAGMFSISLWVLKKSKEKNANRKRRNGGHE